MARLTWAMQFPEPLNTPTAGNAVTPFLDAFLRGNRDDQVRSSDGSISQALDLMNDNFVMSRTKSNGPATSLLVAESGAAQRSTGQQTVHGGARRGRPAPRN